MTKTEIENYKDFKAGDKLKNSFETMVIDSVVGRIYFIIRGIDTKDESAYIYTKNELYDTGWRLDVKPEEEIIELTLEDVAKLKGIDVSQLRIKE